jgi:hypothetical protein
MKTTYLEQYWFARGYFDGRNFGEEKSVEEAQSRGDVFHQTYKSGYECGVTDFSRFDEAKEGV